MVAAVRGGISMRRTAATFHVSLSTVQCWVKRAGNQRLDRVDWSDQPYGPRAPANRTAAAVEAQVLELRRELKDTSPLGEYGAQAIQHALSATDLAPLPHVRTIGRILERRGALDSNRRRRWAAPPPGWYLRDVADKKVELDQFDIVQGLVIRGGIDVFVLNGISLHGGLVVSWPSPAPRAKSVVERLIEHWREVGLPGYAQFDNDTLFQGPHQHQDVLGRVTRLCLNLGVVPVFAPPREPGFQASIEAFNGRWQVKVWSRFEHSSRADLTARSDAYVTAARARAAPRIDAAPPRRPFPAGWHLDLAAQPQGRVIYLRRTNHHGVASLLGHTFPVDLRWPHRLVRAEVDLDAHRIRFYALRRREPTVHKLLCEHPHHLPQRRFKQ